MIAKPELDNDTLLNVLNFSNVRSVFSFAQVSRRFNFLANEQVKLLKKQIQAKTHLDTLLITNPLVYEINSLEKNHKEIILGLLSQQNRSAHANTTGLFLIARLGLATCLKILLTKNSNLLKIDNLSQPENNQLFSLFLATKYGHLNIIKILSQENGYDLKADYTVLGSNYFYTHDNYLSIEEQSLNPIILAATYGHTAIISFWLAEAFRKNELNHLKQSLQKAAVVATEQHHQITADLINDFLEKHSTKFIELKAQSSFTLCNLL